MNSVNPITTLWSRHYTVFSSIWQRTFKRLNLTKNPDSKKSFRISNLGSLAPEPTLFFPFWGLRTELSLLPSSVYGSLPFSVLRKSLLFRYFPPLIPSLSVPLSSTCTCPCEHTQLFWELLGKCKCWRHTYHGARGHSRLGIGPLPDSVQAPT